MPFSAKSAAPRAEVIRVRHPAIERAATSGGLILCGAPNGHLHTDSLAALLASHGRAVVWLRLAPEDGDPATFLLSLIAAAQRLSPEVGQHTLERMRRYPGPTSGWPGLFAQLANELGATLPRDTALVLEHSQYLNDTHPTLNLLSAHLLPALPPTFATMLISDHRLPTIARAADVVCLGADELRLDISAARALSDQAGFSPSGLRRLVGLVDGRAALFLSLCDAAAILGSAPIEQAAERADDANALFTRVARGLLMLSDADAQRALALALHADYTHPDLFAAAFGIADLPPGPWLQSLVDGWARLRAHWRLPLRLALGAGAAPGQAALRRSADYLAEQGALHQAIALYLEVEADDAAAQAIARSAGALLDMGEWETLTELLGQLPAPTLHNWPWLIYAGGELAAARGDTNAARRAFATAAELFGACDDAAGACQSVLAESALAAWQGDHAHARARALAASAAAEAAGLADHQRWAAWQLGCLYASVDLDNALSYFSRAQALTSNADEPLMLDLLQQAEDLVLRQRELRRQRELHRQAYFAAERAEHEAAERLRCLTRTPPEQIDSLLLANGWTHTPLLLKLPAPGLERVEPPAERAVGAPEPEPPTPNVWNRLLHAFGIRRPAPEQPKLALPAQPAEIPPRLLEMPQLAPLEPPRFGLAAPLLEPPRPSVVPMTAPIAALRTSIEVPPPAPDSTPHPADTTLIVHLLGPLRVTLAERQVESWPSGRGRALFKYLIAHRAQPIPRDVLMDLFWPEATPEAARNSLNVAIHGLRQALKAAADLPVVLFQEGAYRLNPELSIWVDVEEFETHVQAGRQLETAGQLIAATAEYEVATGLYQGDFLADDPYEEWPVLARERLRVAYLDMLDRLAQLYFSQSQYAACAALCQLTLAQDNCREDAHCRLMRCYSRQGQQHLALRQYQTCVEALRNELDVEPSPTTQQLYERIRRREQV
jgi:DNA-binding SARP family transcriptional activator